MPATDVVVNVRSLNVSVPMPGMPAPAGAKSLTASAVSTWMLPARGSPESRDTLSLIGFSPAGSLSLPSAASAAVRRRAVVSTWPVKPTVATVRPGKATSCFVSPPAWVVPAIVPSSVTVVVDPFASDSLRGATVSVRSGSATSPPVSMPSQSPPLPRTARAPALRVSVFASPGIFRAGSGTATSRLSMKAPASLAAPARPPHGVCVNSSRSSFPWSGSRAVVPTPTASSSAWSGFERETSRLATTLTPAGRSTPPARCSGSACGPPSIVTSAGGRLAVGMPLASLSGWTTTSAPFASVRSSSGVPLSGGTRSESASEG